MPDDIERLQARADRLRFLVSRITDRQAEEAIRAEKAKVQRQLT